MIWRHTGPRGSRTTGFTIVELLIVVVVIGILAAVTIVAFNGVQNRAVEGVLKQDASGAYRQIENYRTTAGEYPDTTNQVNNGTGVSVSGDTNVEYTKLTDDFCLSVTSDRSDSLAFYIQGSTGSTVFNGVCTGHSGPGGGPSIPAGYEAAPVAAGGTSSLGGYTGIQPASCPTTGGAWVKVPGNSLYGEDNGFCVQQYPAANVGGVATSQPNVNRWTSINLAQAQTNAATAATDAHLLTETEWMTIASNAAMQPSNWSGGSVGSGTLPRGSTTASRGVMSVTLSNGEQVYFDNSNNASFYATSEWTCYEGTNAVNCAIQRQNMPSPGLALHTDQFASFSSYGSLQVNGDGRYYGDPRFANPSLNSFISSARTSGLGWLRSDYAAANTTLFSFTRGYWTGATSSGLFTLYLYTLDTYAYASLGFRAAK